MTRRAETADAPTIARLLHDFNTEFDKFTPGPEALPGASANYSRLPASISVLLREIRPEGSALLSFRPSLWTETLDCYLEELLRASGPARPAAAGGR